MVADRRAGRGERRAEPRRRRVRPALRARPVEPGRVHDRRQRRRERRRPALSQVRRDDEPHPRAHRAAARAARSSRSAARRRDTKATISSAHSSDRRAASASRSTITVRLSRNPEAVRTLLADFHVARRGGASGLGDRRDRHHSGRARDDRPGDDPRGGGVDLRRRLSDRRRGRAAHRARWRDRGTRARRRDGRGALHARMARAPCASRATRPSARASGRDGRKRSARWGASRRTSSCRTRSCRAPSFRKCSRRSAASASDHRVNVCNVFHAGDGNLHPNIAYDATDADESARVHDGDARDHARVRRRRRHDHRRARHRARQAAVHGADLLAGFARRRCARCARSSIRSGVRTRARSFRCTRAASGTMSPAARRAASHA